MILQFFVLTFIIYAYAEMGPAKVKILCLHGYQQNARVIQEKTGALRKFLKNTEFQFLDAPFSVGKDTNHEKDPRGWYFTNQNHTFEFDEHDQCFGLEESLKAIKEKYEKDGPFHGLFGFSQGAALAGIVCADDQMNAIKRYNFVILVSGLVSQIKSMSKYYQQMIHMPSLHIMGETDTLVEKHKSEKLVKLFDPETCEVAVHSKGHIIPFDKDIKLTYKNFIDKYSRVVESTDGS